MPAPTKTCAIAPATATVLRAATVDGARVVLPAGQLDRATYTDVNKVLVALGGKWNRAAAAHVFTEPVGDRLAVALGEGKTVVRSLGYFPTPPELVERMLAHACVEPHHLVLEPSAGQGAIADRLTWPDNLTLVEIQPANCRVLRGKGYAPIEGDFLTVTDGMDERFDRVVMNPPFERGQDIEHVTRALDLTAPGGRVVAIVSSGAIQRSDRKAAEFQRLLDRLGAHVEHNPPGSFKASGTDVNTILVAIERP